MTRLALQTWAEALRDPVLHHRVRQLYVDTLERIGELARTMARPRVSATGVPTPKAVAPTLLSIMFGMIVMHHVVDDVPADALRTGIALLGGAATRPCAAPTTTPAKQTTP